MSSNDSCEKTKLCPCSFGFALGVTVALYMVVFALAGLFFGYGEDAIKLTASLYYGYSASFVGALWGGLWGFIDGFVFGYITAMVYNYCMSRCGAKAK